MYLKYGGKKISSISTNDISNNFFNYIILESVMACILLLVGLIRGSFLILAFSIGMLVTNVLGYLKSLFQATGEFQDYGRALNFEKILVFLAQMMLIFFIKSDSYYSYINVQVIAGCVTVLILIFSLRKKIGLHIVGQFSIHEYSSNIKLGFVLMLGNFSSIFFTGIDRVFIKILMDTTAFALYSFAVSMENIINTFMTPITVTLYNYFCKDINIQNTKKLKNLVLIWGFIIIGAAFPLKWILENFLHKYIGAISVMFFLFAAQAFLVVIRGIYVNIYKAELKQSRYFKQMLIMITVGTILNGVLYTVFKSMWSIAVATLITSIIWLVICECESKDIRFNSSEYFAIILLLGSYLICGHKLSAIIGMIIYYASGVVIILLLMRQSTKQIVDIVWIYFKKVYNKLMLINSNHLSK